MSTPAVDPLLFRRVHEITQHIPAGMVSSYGEIATIVGGGADGRAVGMALAALGPDSADVPWQRVISRDGTISTRGLRQRELLEAEGVTFDAQDRVIMARHRWPGPDAAWCAEHGYTPLPQRPPEPEQLELF